MLRPGLLLRVFSIQRLLIRYGLDEMLLNSPLFRSVRFLFYLLPWNWTRRPHKEQRGRRLRLLLEELGPVYIKFGQLLSTRPDLTPEDISEELALLQDRVAPFPGAEARRQVEAALGRPIDDLFREFEEQPLASASIAQVHGAVLLDGRRVIVKVPRPGLRGSIRYDLELLRLVAVSLERYWREARALRPTGVVDEFEKTLYAEFDFLREAANAAQLRRNHKDSASLHIPAVIWEYSRSELLVMERVSGIPIGNRAALERAGVQLDWIAEELVRLFFTMIFRDSFFHADLHPGNLFILPASEGQPCRIALVDFGITGTLSERDQRYLAENFLAFLERDYARVAQLHVESGWVPPGTRTDEFEAAVRTVCEPLLDRPLRQISFGLLLLRLLRIARQFRMEILPQLLLLQKSLVNLEGLGRSLYPDLELWKTVRVQMEQWLKSRVGMGGIWRQSKRRLPHWLERLPQAPSRALEALERLHENRLELGFRSTDLRALHVELRAGMRRLFMVLAGGLLLVTAAVLALGEPSGWLRLCSWGATCGGLLLLALGLRALFFQEPRD